MTISTVMPFVRGFVPSVVAALHSISSHVNTCISGHNHETFVVKGEVKAKIKISPVVVFGVLSRMVVVRGS